jgi:hypothetical protein
MAFTEADIYEIKAKLAPLIGQKPWGVSLGFGSFITLEFGQAIPPSKKYKKTPKKTHGEWHLWVYMCAWRLEKNNKFIAGSGADLSELAKVVQMMEGMSIDSIEILPVAGDTIIYFEEELVLRIFSIYSSVNELWMLFAPDGNVLKIGPGTNWYYKPGNSVKD